MERPVGHAATARLIKDGFQGACSRGGEVGEDEGDGVAANQFRRQVEAAGEGLVDELDRVRRLCREESLGDRAVLKGLGNGDYL